MGNGEWGIGSGEWELDALPPIPHSPLPIPYFASSSAPMNRSSWTPKEKLALTTLQKRCRNGDQRLSQLSM
jgi:hypothetical protein